MIDPVICIIPGDGIGAEVMASALEVLRATGLPLCFAEYGAGWATFQATGVALPDVTLAAAKAATAVLFGAVASPLSPVPGYRSPIVALRRALDLYANIRPTVGSRDGQRVDLVVVRENTEGMYAGRERTEDGGDTAIAERVITRVASERIARAAFELATARAEAGGRQAKVTIVHKANVLRETCGLFRSAALAVARDYPAMAADELLVDNCALQLVLRPEHFDVLVTTNLFGDIISDVASAWGGGLGLATSASYGPQTALFEPVHGAAPDIAGKGIANPLAAIGCAALLLGYLAGTVETSADYRAWSSRIAAAVAHVTAHGPHTPDLGGTATTADVTRAIVGTVTA